MGATTGEAATADVPRGFATGAGVGEDAAVTSPSPSALTRAGRAAVRVLAPVGRFVRRPVVVDTLVVGTFTAWSLLLGLGADSMLDLSTYLGARVTGMQVLSFVLTVAGAVALSRRRAHPVPVAVAVGTLTLVSLVGAGATHGFELAVAAALGQVAAVRPARTAWLVAAGVVLPVVVVARYVPLVAVVGTRLLGGDPDDAAGSVPPGLADLVTPWWAVTAVPVVVLALVAVAAGAALRTHRQRAAEAVAARARDAAQRARLTRAAERARVAREMHDVVAHSLTVMVALGGGAAAALDRSPDRARAALDELVETGRTALDDVRRILDVLHAEEDPVPGQVVGAAPVGGAERDDHGRAAVDGDGVGRRGAVGDDGRLGAQAGPDGDGRAPMAPQPGADDLARLVERFRTAGLPVRTSGLAVTGLDALGATRQLAVYRVVQEALTNTLRHAPGSPRVEVDVRRDGGTLVVVVTDAGPGDGAAPAAPGTRRGVVGMTERVAAFGGTVEAGPHGPGWRVRARLPWHEGDA